MKKVRLSVLLFSLFPAYCLAQENLSGPRISGTAGAGVALPDEWSGFQNEALLAFETDGATGVAYENRFLLKELGTSIGFLFLPTKAGVFGTTISFYGFDLYSQLKAGFSYSAKFGNLAAGMKIHYHRTTFGDGYGTRNAFTISTGFALKVSDELILAAHLTNPNRTLIDKNLEEPYPTVLKSGATYQFSEQVLITGEFYASNDAKAFFKGGLEYRLHEALWLRGGFAGKMNISSFGTSILYNKLRFDFSATWHPNLGISPNGGILYVFE